MMNAEIFAAKKHSGQMYGKVHTYDFHLRQVVENLKEFGYTEKKYLDAGWLHDTLEDTNTTVMELKMNFGHEVYDMVWAVTAVGVTREAGTLDTIRKLENCPQAIPVKMADRLANMRFSRSEFEAGRGDRIRKYTQELDKYATLFKSCNLAMYEEMRKLCVS
jgi:(p)ppGpp synthase/HD superfamily hydrolase